MISDNKFTKNEIEKYAFWTFEESLINPDGKMAASGSIAAAATF